ncbi:MAG TPA: T9SS type A sorting domain-containing protein, partial [Salinivirgaceae bacterium]|nr:T9SS type A sorting domain-containing protein [Salinivirgaceae bacterium]
LSTFGFDCNGGNSATVEFDQLILAPNPNNGKFYLLNTLSDIKNAKIVIYSINGQIILEENGVDILKNERKYFNLSGFSGNVYILKIMSTNYSEQKKIIITNNKP